MGSKQKAQHPFGGWFGTIGFFVGVFLGVDLGLEFVGVIVVALICGFLGIIVEHIVAKLLVFAAIILFILIRREILQSILDALLNYSGIQRR